MACRGRARERGSRAGLTTSEAVAFDGARAVCVAYVAAESATVWGISIDTIERRRRQGFARAAVTRLLQRMHRNVKAPVWGVGAQHCICDARRRLGFVERDVVRLPSIDGE